MQRRGEYSMSIIRTSAVGIPRVVSALGAVAPGVRGDSWLAMATQLLDARPDLESILRRRFGDQAGLWRYFTTMGRDQRVLVAPGGARMDILNLARHVREVVVCDLHGEYAELTRRMALEDGLTNIQCQVVAGLDRLPFQDGEFSLTWSSFEDGEARKREHLESVLRELRRVAGDGEVVVTWTDSRTLSDALSRWFKPGPKPGAGVPTFVFAALKPSGPGSERILETNTNGAFYVPQEAKRDDSASPAGGSPWQRVSGAYRSIRKRTMRVQLLSVGPEDRRPFLLRLLAAAGYPAAEVEHCHASIKGTAAVRVRLDDGGERGTLVIPGSKVAESYARRNYRVVSELLQEPLLPAATRRLILQPITAGEHEGQAFYLYRWVSGLNGYPAAQGGVAPAVVTRRGFEFLDSLPAKSPAELLAGGALRDLLAGHREAIARLCGSEDDRSRLDAVIDQVRTALEGLQLRATFIHGDFVPQNLIFTDSAEELQGVIDWEFGSTRSAAVIDYLQLVLSQDRAVRGIVFGEQVVECLRAGSREAPLAWEVSGVAQHLQLPAGRLRQLVMLYWLHVTSRQAPFFHDRTFDRRWVSENVTAVLSASAECRA
jgi:hypothetical protein